MFCPKCGSNISDQAKFCPKCGAAVSRPGSAAPDSAAPADPTDTARQSYQARTEAAKATATKAAKAAAAATEKAKVAAVVTAKATAAAAATAKEKAAAAREKVAASGSGTKRKAALIAAALVVVVVIVLVALPGPSKDVNSQDGLSDSGWTEDGSGVTNDNGTSDDGSSADGSDGAVAEMQRDISDESEIYQENYQYIIDHQGEIIALYWQVTRETLAADFIGSLEGIFDLINVVDPEFFDYAASSIADKYANNQLEGHLIDKGVRTYFSDSELGSTLRGITENLLVYALFNSSSKKDQIPMDELTYCGGNLDYTLMQTRGTIGDIVSQMSIDSGYTTAKPALDWYYDLLFEYNSENITEEMNIYWNSDDEDEVAAVRAKWDANRGRLHAVEDCRQAWMNGRMEWIKAFCSDIGLDFDNATETDLAKHVYCIFDRAGNQHCVFVALDLADLTVLNDGTCVYREGPEENATLMKRDIDGNVLCSYPGVDIRGYNTISSSSMDLVDRYFSIAPCGNVLRKRTESDFDNGDYQILELVHPDGTAEEILRGKIFENALPYYADQPYYYGKDGNSNRGWSYGNQNSCNVFQTTYRSLDGYGEMRIVEMDTGKTYIESDYISQHGSELQPSDVAINSRYYLDNENQLYAQDKPETAVADLSSGGGVNRMFYSEINDQYWVISNSGYYYVLDSNFTRIHEPIQLTKDAYDLCPFGIILYEEDGSMGLYDAEGKQITAFPKADVKGFMADNINIITGEQLYLDLT